MARRQLTWARAVAILVVALVVWWGKRAPEATDELRPGAWVEIHGQVTKTLRDDTHPPRHQRFIITIDGGRTLLVAHNIDLAPRVPVQRGDAIEVRGEYETNPKGGVIHWTHHDPDGRRPGGWIRHEGKQYR